MRRYTRGEFLKLGAAIAGAAGLTRLPLVRRAPAQGGGATRQAPRVAAEPGKPQGYEETGSVSSRLPGVGFSAKTSNAPNHTYEMEQDALGEVGHRGFVTDAQAMAALLYDFATRADYRAAVKREFDGLRALHEEYLEALRKVYVVPKVAEPK